MSWAWWDWPLTWLTNHQPSVLWHCWLGHLTRKIVSEMTYNVSSGTLYPTIPYHTYFGNTFVRSVVRRVIDEQIIWVHFLFSAKHLASACIPTGWFRRSRECIQCIVCGCLQLTACHVGCSPQGWLKKLMVSSAMPRLEPVVVCQHSADQR